MVVKAASARWAMASTPSLSAIGDAFDAGDDGGDALGQVVGELAEIAQDGRQADGEEDARG